jgi:hypothetical protein
VTIEALRPTQREAIAERMGLSYAPFRGWKIKTLFPRLAPGAIVLRPLTRAPTFGTSFHIFCPGEEPRELFISDTALPTCEMERYESMTSN